MATPVGHSLIGLALGRMSRSHTILKSWQWYLFSVLAANGPDFDFIASLMTGDINRFHQGPSHSLLAAVLFGVAMALILRPYGKSSFLIGMASSGLYASHLLLDFFCEDRRAPFGIPLFWPLSKEHFMSPWPILKGVRHGVPGEGFIAFLSHIFSFHNILVIGLESALLLPGLFLAWYLFRRRSEESGDVRPMPQMMPKL